MTLKLIGKLAGQEWDFDVADVGSSRLYYTFEDFQLPEDFLDGIYNYELYDDDDEIVAVGLIQVGDFKDDSAIIYNVGNTERVVYDG